MTILFATDLSARAMLAGDVAACLARAVDERLVVLHVAQRGDDFEVLDRELARLESTARTELAVHLGPVTVTIEQVARERAPRYVVVGAQGQSARALLGTVATALAARLPMPIFVVRAGERLMPFFEKGRPLRAVLTHGLDGTFSGARDVLIELSRIGPVDVVVVYASPGSAPLAADARVALERELRASLGALPGVDSRVLVRDGSADANTRLLDVVSEIDPDIVLCGTHQRRGLERIVEGSTASFLAREAPCTVVVAPMS